MRTVLFTVLLFSIYSSLAQEVPPKAPPPVPPTRSASTSSMSMVRQLEERVYENGCLPTAGAGKALRDAYGTPFLHEEWSAGSVILTNGKIVNNLELKFDVYQNKLYFLRNGATLEFVDSVKDFYLERTDNKVAGLVFRNHFPPINENTTQTFYELLVDGKLSLLLYRSKRLTYPDGAYAGKPAAKLEDDQQLYVCDGSKMSKIARTEKSLVKALPQYEAKIREIRSRENLNLHSNESMIELFTKLNK